MPIKGKGWELHVERLEVHKKGTFKRTFGSYQVFIEGVAQPGLSGFMCESRGPGDNSPTGKNKLRVEPGRYQLSTQFGRYRSIGYSKNDQVQGQLPMPGFRLEDRGVRTDILVHPGHPGSPGKPGLYLSSIGCLNPTAQLGAGDLMNFWDSRQRAIDMIDSLAKFSPASFKHEVITEIPGAFAVIDGELLEGVQAAPVVASRAEAPGLALAALAIPPSLPISESAARNCATWLVTNFANELAQAVRGKPYGVEHLAAIVCQETAVKWVPWIGQETTATIVQRAVYDASGDFPGTSRGAFPANTAAFREKFGKTFTNMLIAEANATRALLGWEPKSWVYKGYGLFQYDLQHVGIDRAFFDEKQWYDFKACLARCTKVLDTKIVATKGDLWKAIRAYNGSGPRAERYMENVRFYTPICAAAMGARAAPQAAPRAAARGRAGVAGNRWLRAPVAAAARLRTPSGPDWVARFPDGGDVETLEPTFGAACKAFIAALNAAGATIDIQSTRRPRERAYLMNGAWRIAEEGEDPQDIEPFAGVDIEWVHRKPNGNMDLVASKKAAASMAAKYGLAFKPSLTSNHILGKAIDMSIRWPGTLKIVNGRGKTVTIAGTPRSGNHPELWPVGATYGVKKLERDVPHWSANGR